MFYLCEQAFSLSLTRPVTSCITSCSLWYQGTHCTALKISYFPYLFTPVAFKYAGSCACCHSCCNGWQFLCPGLRCFISISSTILILNYHLFQEICTWAWWLLTVFRLWIKAGNLSLNYLRVLAILNHATWDSQVGNMSFHQVCTDAGVIHAN